MKKVKGCISFSLYGDMAKYSYGMLENVRLARKFYPGWVVRIYVERGHYATERLKEEGADIIEKDPLPGSGGMFWRFLPIDDLAFTHVIIRDADSRINPRDVACTEAWIKSGKSLHVIRDHFWHEQKPIMGGAWGMMAGKFRMADAIKKWPHDNRYGDDEKFLGDRLWPEFYPKDFLRHSHAPKSADDTPIPDHAEYAGFICEQIEPIFQEPHRVVYLSPEKNGNRRKRFIQSWQKNASFLATPEWVVGTTSADRLLPRHFDLIKEFPHYYLASTDHIDILEREVLAETQTLFVFEDDAEFNEHFAEYFLRMWVALPKDWLGAMLGGQAHTDHNRKILSPETRTAIARISGCLGMHAVLWNRNGMVRAWNHFHYWNRKTIDQSFADLQKEEPHFYAPARWIVGIDPGTVQFGGGD